MCNIKITKCGGRGGHLQHVKLHFSDCGKSPWKVATLWLSARSPGYQTGSSFQQLSLLNAKWNVPHCLRHVSREL